MDPDVKRCIFASYAPERIPVRPGEIEKFAMHLIIKLPSEMFMTVAILPS